MQYSLLLKAALSSNRLDPGVKFRDGRLTGHYTIDPHCRAFSGATHVFDNDLAFDKIEQKISSSTVLLSPQHIDPEHIVKVFEADPPAKLGMLNLKHGLEKKDEHLYWDTSYCVDAAEEGDEENWQHESIKSTFLSFKENDPAGFFGFRIELVQDEDYTTYYVYLDLIHVRPQFRHFGVHGLDMGVAVALLTISIYEDILNNYRGRNPIDVVLRANFSSRGGEKIGKLIWCEFKWFMDGIDEDINPPHIFKNRGNLEPDLEDFLDYDPDY